MPEKSGGEGAAVTAEKSRAPLTRANHRAIAGVRFRNQPSFVILQSPEDETVNVPISTASDIVQSTARLFFSLLHVLFDHTSLQALCTRRGENREQTKDLPHRAATTHGPARVARQGARTRRYIRSPK